MGWQSGRAPILGARAADVCLQSDRKEKGLWLRRSMRFADTLCPPAFLQGILHIVTFEQGPALALLPSHWGKGTEGLRSTLR